MPADFQDRHFERVCRECVTHLDLTGWCPTCREVMDSRQDRREEFLRRFDDLVAYASAQPFKGRQKALRALEQVRKQRGLA